MNPSVAWENKNPDNETPQYRNKFDWRVITGKCMKSQRCLSFHQICRERKKKCYLGRVVLDGNTIPGDCSGASPAFQCPELQTTFAALSETHQAQFATGAAVRSPLFTVMKSHRLYKFVLITSHRCLSNKCRVGVVSCLLFWIKSC